MSKIIMDNAMSVVQSEHALKLALSVIEAMKSGCGFSGFSNTKDECLAVYGECLKRVRVLWDEDFNV